MDTLSIKVKLTRVRLISYVGLKPELNQYDVYNYLEMFVSKCLLSNAQLMCIDLSTTNIPIHLPIFNISYYDTHVQFESVCDGFSISADVFRCLSNDLGNLGQSSRIED